MTMISSIALIGGDLRQQYLANFFSAQHVPVSCYAIDLAAQTPPIKQMHSFLETLQNNTILVFPICFTTDQMQICTTKPQHDLTIETLQNHLQPSHILFGGGFPDPFLSFCQKHHISCFDFQKEEQVLYPNAIATAEGAIMQAFLHSVITLHQSNCLVLGYGRCARILAQKLSGLNASVCICARNPDALIQAQSFGYEAKPLSTLSEIVNDYSFIFNTIPSVILSELILKRTKEDVVLIDLASSPGGIDYIAAQKLHRQAYFCPGLPGKIAPKTSALILGNFIHAKLKERRNL